MHARHALALAAVVGATLVAGCPATPNAAAPRVGAGATSCEGASFSLPDDSVVGRHRLFLDPVTAEVLRIDRHASLDFGGRVFANMAPWHFGSFGGRLTQWLWFVVGLVPALLLGSGFWLWLRKRRRKARATGA